MKKYSILLSINSTGASNDSRTKHTKIRIYRESVLTVLPYESDTWPNIESHLNIEPSSGVPSKVSEEDSKD